MNQNVNHIARPAWIPLASGTFKAMQHRKAPGAPYYGTGDDDPLGDLLNGPDQMPPMIDLCEEWNSMKGAYSVAFAIKRPDRIATTLELLAANRLCATFSDRETVEAICDPAAITLLDVGHPDWIQHASRAMRDLLPDHVVFSSFDEHKKGDLLILAPHATEDLSNAKDAAKFAKSIADGLDREVPILIITAGHSALPDRITRVLPSPIRLIPLHADMVLAMLHLKFEDGDAGAHAALRNALPASDSRRHQTRCVTHMCDTPKLERPNAMTSNGYPSYLLRLSPPEATLLSVGRRPEARDQQQSGPWPGFHLNQRVTTRNPARKSCRCTPPIPVLLCRNGH